jgi:hypothetical protein
MATRTLHVRCGTWEQVEVFTTRKLRKGKLLSMKVPFPAKVGGAVTIGLELPNEVVLAIDGLIQKSAAVEGDANRTWIEIELTGFTDEVKARLKAFQAKPEPEPETDPQIMPIPPARRSTTNVGDHDLPADERELFKHLTGELRRLRSAAVHEVLGVPRNAGPRVRPPPPGDGRRGTRDARRSHAVEAAGLARRVRGHPERSRERACTEEVTEPVRAAADARSGTRSSTPDRDDGQRQDTGGAGR